MILDTLPIYQTNTPGHDFVVERKLSWSYYIRMMKKLHWDYVNNRYDLVTALLEKDTQRLRRTISKYVESEKEKYNDVGIFIRIPITAQELVNVNYIIYYRIFAELSVREIEKEK